ncbi:MAG: hypothetical protein Q9225_001153 [Loekoesia sp. 1 TL-2023]
MDGDSSAIRLYSRVFQIPLQPPSQAPQPSPSTKPRKRPAASSETAMGLNRELQPRTSGFVTVNEPIESTAYPPALADNPDQRKKKRGRPSKAEAEVKAAEYAARGEPYPPPRKSKNPKPSAEGTSTMGPSITFTPVSMGPSGMEGTSPGKKRTSKPKTQKDDIPGYGPTVSPIEQVHGETGEPTQTHGLHLQTSQPETSEPTVVGVSPAVQGSTTEGQNVTESHQYQSTQVMPSEGLSSREEASTEHRPEAANDTLQASSTTPQRATAEHGSPNIMHSPT